MKPKPKQNISFALDKKKECKAHSYENFRLISHFLCVCHSIYKHTEQRYAEMFIVLCGDMNTIFDRIIHTCS